MLIIFLFDMCFCGLFGAGFIILQSNGVPTSISLCVHSKHSLFPPSLQETGVGFLGRTACMSTEAWGGVCAHCS